MGQGYDMLDEAKGCLRVVGYGLLGIVLVVAVLLATGVL